MTDYSKIIDSETWNFIAQTNAHYPEVVVATSISEQRAVYNAMCASFHNGIPDGVQTHDDKCNGVPVRHYRPDAPHADAIIIYFHGGGFVVGGLDSHDDVCAEICAGTGCDVINVDYRLAPEHTAPAQFDDCLAVIKWQAARDARRIILVGDSAGGHLAAIISHHLRGSRIGIAGQLLIYAALGGDINAGSYITHAQAPLLTRDDILFYKAALQGSAPAATTPPEPLDDTDFSNLPPSVIIAAECDPLADDSRQYHDRLIAAGTPSRLHVEAGLVHGYLRARHSAERARQSFAHIITGCRDLVAGGFTG